MPPPPTGHHSRVTGLSRAAKQRLKGLLYAVAPRWTTEVMSARSRAHAHRVLVDWGCDTVNRKLFEQFGNRVRQGPFAGLILTPMTAAEQAGPYLLGLYESELFEAWSLVLRGEYSAIVDIGSKFGYYAVGLAKKYPATPVIAFDTDTWARTALREMAAANAVHNLTIRRFCDPPWLAAHADGRTLIISDCEGYEAQLFAGSMAKRLRAATLVIETHDCFVPGVTRALRSAFEPTHDVRVFASDPDRRAMPPDLSFLSAAERSLATEEVRPSQEWLLCLPKEGQDQSAVGRS